MIIFVFNYGLIPPANESLQYVKINQRPYCRKFTCAGTETPDMSYPQSIGPLSDVSHTGDMDQHSRTCMLNIEDEMCMNDDTIRSNNSVILKKQVSSFQDEDYTQSIKQFQLHVDTVKTLVKPGCSPEMLNAALGSISSLIDTLSFITSKRCIRASL